MHVACAYRYVWVFVYVNMCMLFYIALVLP